MLDFMTKKSRKKPKAFATPVAEVTVLLDSILRNAQMNSGKAHIPTRNLGEPQKVPSWVEHTSGGIGGPHPVVDICPNLSLRAKSYSGVKCWCSQGLHIPAITFIGK